MRTKLTLAAFGTVAATALACGSGSTVGPGAQGPAAKTADRTIVMEVTGAAVADITYGLGTDQSQDNGAKLPWKKQLTSKDAILLTTVLAQNKGSGTIACKITVDGKVVKENKSSGQYAVVTCSGS